MVELPEIPDTANELLAAIDNTEHPDVRQVERILGSPDQRDTARGRAARIYELSQKYPRTGYMADIPTLFLKDKRDQPLSAPERRTLMAINEEVLRKLYEEYGVDESLTTTEDFEHGGYVSKTTTYRAPESGIAFVDDRIYDEKSASPEIPTSIWVEVQPLVDGEPLPGTYLLPIEFPEAA